MATFMNPFTDVGFKRIFGQEFSKPLLIDFLNSLFEGQRHIVDVTYLDKEQLGLFDQDRSLIYDIYCDLDTGEKIIVEMQNCKQSHFKSRSVYYLCESIARQGEKGTAWQYDIKAVYLIAFLNFSLPDIGDKVRTNVALMNTDTKQVFSDLVNITYLQLPYFDKEEKECETNFDRWIYLLTHMETIAKLPWPEKNPVFQRLAEISDLGSLSKEERLKYDEALRKYRDTLCVMQGQYDEGIQVGMEKGRVEERISIAKMMKADNVDITKIMAYTGLSPEIIKKLS